MTALVQFWISHGAEFATRLGQHIVLVAVSTCVSSAIAVPLGVFSAHRRRVGAPLVAAANIVQTIPSLAMFGFLLPVPLLGGVGARAALVALILYGLLPILRTTIAGINGIDPAIRQAAVALGMTPRNLLWQVELPLAMPSIVAGIRIAAVVSVGSATIAAAIGAGGLGEYIYRGLSMVDNTVILAGAIPAALLAVLVDTGLWLAERQFSKRRRRRPPLAAVAGVLLTIGAVVGGGAVMASRSAADVVVGSKNFTEQVILGELVAQTIERDTGLTVGRRLNLGGTLICERALAGGNIDVYVEYTGTALTAVFHQPIDKDPRRVFETVRERYAQSGRTLLPSLGFNNTFAILVRGRDARARQLKTIDDAAQLAAGWKAGFGYEFLERQDGFPGLSAAYNLHFAGPPSVMDLTLSYRALASGQVDLIAGDVTAGLIKGLDLFRLEDNRHYFPPYDAVPVARTATLLRYPAVRRALEGLAGRISADQMQAMNDAVDARHQDPADVVRRFLAAR
jgi:osmoprotectant transport system permease protein